MTSGSHITEVTKENADNFYDWLTSQHDRIRKCSKEARKAAELYYRPIVDGNKKIAIVDIGWRGTGSLSLKKFINEELHISCQATGILAGNSKHRATNDSSLDLMGDLVSYMFSENHNKDLAQDFADNSGKYMPVFELLGGGRHRCRLFWVFICKGKIMHWILMSRKLQIIKE